jgi:hypothetical protein
MIPISGEKIERTKYVYLFTFNGNKRIERATDLRSPLLSIYSPFTFSEEQNQLFIINEDESQEDPEVVKYHVVPTIL